MSRQRFVWFHQVRGLSPAERNVLEYMSRVSDDDGVIRNGLFSRTIALKCETTQNNVFKIIRVLIERKKFIKLRIKRPQGQKAKTPANGYAMDLTRYRPAGDDLGMQLWLRVTKVMSAADHAVEIHVRKTDAWYNRKTKTLTVWFESAGSHNFFVSQIQPLLKICRSNKPKIALVEFLGKLPPADFDA